MTLLESLKFVAGSVARKDFVSELTHFRIEHGKVRGFNGTIALCSPIPFDIACLPKAEKLVKAIANCKDTVQLSMTPGGKLTVKSGSFKVHIESIEGDTPHVHPEGTIVQFDGEKFYEGVKRVAPFIGEDASRKWAQGILVRDRSLYATNNVCLVQYWLGIDFPHTINIPGAAIKEMMRVKEAPLYAQVAEGSVTFHYTGDRWLRTQLYSLTEWPDLASRLNAPSNPTQIPETFFEAIDSIAPFVDQLGSVHFNGGRMFTHNDESEGASFEVPGLVNEGLYNIKYLKLLEGLAARVDWTTYPRPCAFLSEDNLLRGVLIGMKK
jgi:hypothetical protein